MGGGGGGGDGDAGGRKTASTVAAMGCGWQRGTHCVVCVQDRD